MSYLKNKDTITNKVHIKSTKDISGKQSLLMIPLAKFFSVKNNMDKLLNVLNGDSRISLRLIDWFVTNYAKKHNIMYIVSDYNNYINKKKKKTKKKEKEIKASFSNYFSVFHNYKLQLKEVSKKHFDPFCRRTRINFYYDTLNENKYILTTVGQLNFFKWAIENNILEYIEESFEEIEDDMNENSKTPKSKKISNKKDGDIEDGNCFKDDKVKKKSGSTKDKKGKTKKKSPGSTHRKKRKELSSSASKSIIRHNYPTVIKFD